jgi:hypothetical protein
MPGARCTRSLACNKNKTHERSHHGHTGITRHSPRNGFTVSFVLSPVSRALLPPSSAVCLRRLDTSVRVSGPHDFAVRRRHVRQRAALTSTASRPASVTIASRPLWKERDGDGYIADLGLRKSRIFFAEGLDRKQPDGQITASQARNSPSLIPAARP